MGRGICINYDQPTSLQIQLSHYRQKYNWDCGLSCVLMVLPRKARLHFLDNFDKICKEEGFNKSTWTIDLCYLLRRYNVDLVYHTVTIGVHPAHANSSFYNKILTKDETRVNKRFENAEMYGVRIKKGSLSINYVLRQLMQGPAIVLTNAQLIYCDRCKFNKIKTELRKCIPFTPSYQGHYIVLCGYDVKLGRVYYRNPSFNDHVCIMPILNLQESWKSFGTDEDIIFINNVK
ncbi:protein GUCD1 isoform X2 [Aethina tumida]|uniref:protein GUCD1 isoform X2 n=1 Tax=Aethina tumida TaxID=116153 RepID=UPI0021492462|nr:protein GUCD1 isoform X2 [Aethina tumida]